MNTNLGCFLRNPRENGTIQKIDSISIRIVNSLSIVKYMNCVTLNLEKIICEFEKVPGTTSTSYELLFRFVNEKDSYQSMCHIQNRGSILTSKILIFGNAIGQKLYNFTLISRNGHTEISENFQYNVTALVQPSPINFTIENIASRSVKVSWPNIIRSYDEFKIIGLMEIKPNDSLVWTEVDMTKVDKTLNGRDMINITLSAYSHYELRLKVRPDSSLESGDLWSSYTSQTFRTLPYVPEAVPVLDKSNFYINDFQEIFIYWSELPKNKWNDQNIEYYITEILEDGQPR